MWVYTAEETQGEIAQQVNLGLSELMKYPQINAFAMWSQASSEVEPFNYGNCFVCRHVDRLHFRQR